MSQVPAARGVALGGAAVRPMRPLARGILAAAALGLAATLLPSHRPAPVLDAGVRRAHPYRVRGAVHVHTALSKDARGDLDQVARDARDAGLDFVVVTDHGADTSLASEGYRQGVLVLGGMEKSTDAGHALVLGTPPLPFGLDGDPATVVEDALSFGGFVVAAHPTSRHAEGPWTAGLEGLAGIEVVNFAEPQAWPEPGLGLLWPFVSYAADPGGALLRHFRFNRDAVRRWDEALRRRPLAGFLGSDAHGGFPAGPVFVPVPSHGRIFRFASQHLLLHEALARDPAAARGQILDGLRTGRGYIGFDALAPASGFMLEAEAGGQRALMGESLPLSGEATIRAAADAPAGTTLILLQDGREVARGERIAHRTRDAGVYRVEAHLDPRRASGRAFPWILSNPISLFPTEELAVRARRGDPVRQNDTVPPSSVTRLDAFDDSALRTSWQIDKTADARGAIREEDGALLFAYTLGPRSTSHASVCDWKERDLSAYRTLVFRVRSDRPVRFDLQVRTIDPAVPLGMRIWRRSVRAGDAWGWIVVPLASLGTYDRLGGEPDFRHVHGIYFHLDEAHLPAGSSGRLWLDDIGFGT